MIKQTSLPFIAIAAALTLAGPLAAADGGYYLKQNFGFNDCTALSWSAQRQNVTYESMGKWAASKGSQGFTMHPEGLYGQILNGPYPASCQSPSNMSWPLFLAGTYVGQKFGFNACKGISWSSQRQNVTFQAMAEWAASENSQGFTMHPEGLYGQILTGPYPADCKSDPSLSWPLFLVEQR